MPIRLLSPELAAQIAAGEVVERPASVVKELVENAIDAGATRISVEIRGGGIERIRVVDDGSGIPPEEVALAFQHHATSKLSGPEQLDAIGTLGFRGEALPSIAAVSRMTLTTRPATADRGYFIEFVWGKGRKEGAEGGPPGTAVTVADLFGNLPARRKFLKSANAEGGRVHELVARYALAYPEIAFRLTVGDRAALVTAGNGRAAEVALAVYGAEAAAALLEVEGADPETGYRVAGFAGAPNLHRANRTYMTFFVNRRWIQSRLLSFALEESYHGLLPEKRYPVAALNLILPYDAVDVNSHPAKREVRFRQEGKVYAALQRAARAVLVGAAPVRDMGGPVRPAGTGGNTWTPGFFRSPFDARSPGNAAVSGVGRAGDGSGPAGAALTPQQALPALRVVGQVRLTYIVAESPDGMYLVDQHAAHERVLFDRIVQGTAQREVQAQPLLEPAVVELTPAQAETLEGGRESLRAYGFEVEPFGEGNSYLLRAMPAMLTTQDPARSLRDVLDLAAFEGLLKEREDILAASVACHSAIRAGQSLTEGEMRGLLEQLEVTDNPHTCPHGRPTLLHFSSYQMEREFGRR